MTADASESIALRGVLGEEFTGMPSSHRLISKIVLCVHAVSVTAACSALGFMYLFPPQRTSGEKRGGEKVSGTVILRHLFFPLSITVPDTFPVP